MPTGARECLAIDEVLDFYEGRLGGAALAAIELHLDGCEACRLWLSELAPLISPNPHAGAPQPRGATFEPGMLIAGRYRVVRFLAEGGMGEVYEVEDVDLGERVALKTVRAVMADDALAVERLKREVSLARRVTHENVCRIFDLGTSEPRAGERITFLTMELLDGESLSDRIRRGGLTAAEALPLARQMAEALDAAHRVGVVHRDFKSSNVMLVPAVGGPRVVVTDFGLAQDAGSGAGDALVGSPAYMAPEQVEGTVVGPRADLYAFGVVLFEMLTARLPFDGATAAALAAQRLTKDPPSPRRFVPSLPQAWERVIARALERRPEARFATSRELVRMLERRRTPRLGWVGLALALAALGSVLVAQRLRATRARTARTATAVLGLFDQSSHPSADSAWRGPALAELLSAELARSRELRVVPTTTVAAMQRDLALPVAERYDAPALSRVRRRVDADWIVAGSYVVDGDSLTVDLVLEDAVRGDSVVRLHDADRTDAMPALVERVATRLRRQLGLSLRAGAAAGGSALPSSAVAARLYVEGLVHARASDVRAARELLERAVSVEPDFPLAHAALAELYLGLRLHARARDEAKAALDRATDLPRDEQLAVEARYHVAADDWPKAIEIYRALCTFYPDDLDDGLALARAQSRGGRAPDAIVTIARLRRLPRPVGDDPRIDQNEALAWAKQGDWKKRLAATERAIAGARAMGAKIMLADNELSAAETVLALGDPVRAEALYRDAERIFEEMGDQSSAMESMIGLADLQRNRGDSRGAAAIYERVIAYHRSVGDDFGVADKLNRLAQIVEDYGESERSKKLFAESLARFTAIGEREGIANVLNNSANLFATEGTLDVAERQFAEAIPIYRAIGMRTHEASTLGNLAYVERRQGRFADARADLAKCLEMIDTVGDEQKRLQFETDLGALEREQDRLPASQRAWQAARARAQRLAQTMFVQQADVALAQLAVDEGKAADAERLAHIGAAPFTGGDPKEPAAASLAVLARALVLGGKKAEALQTAERAWELVAHSEDLSTRADAHAALVTARVAAGECASALVEARALQREAAARQPVDEQLEAGLARGLAESACGQRAEGRALLSSVAARATATGFLRIARLARIFL